MAEQVNKINNYERCTMCLQILVEKTEVRELPCEHLVCSQCLKERNKTVRGVKCSVENCRTEHGKLDIETLRVVFIQYACETENCQLQADWFCTGCVHMLCSKHRQGHDSILSKHKDDVISLEDYKEDREKLAPRMCAVESHTKERVRMACIKCFKPICDRCVTTVTNCDKTEQGKHDVKFAEDLEIVYKERYRNIAGRLADFESDMMDISKKAWAVYDEYEQHNDRIGQEIQNIAKTMIEKIEEASKILSGQMTALSGFYYHETKEFDERVEKLKNRAKEGQVTVTELAVRNVLDSIQKPELISAVENITKVGAPEVPDIPKFIVINIDSVLSTRAAGKFISTPQHQLTFKQTIKQHCLSAVYVHGELITGGFGKITGLANELKITGEIISMCVDEENPSHIYLLNRLKNEYEYTSIFHRLNIITLKIVEINNLNRFSIENFHWQNITVVNEHLAVTSPNSVKIFSKQDGQHQYDITLDELRGHPPGIDYLSNGTIVVSNYIANTVLNITVDRKPQVIWKIELKEPAVVKVNRSDGYILVSDYNNNKISLLNYKGELLSTLMLPTDHPTSCIIDMSFYKDCIALVSSPIFVTGKGNVYNINSRSEITAKRHERISD